MKKPLLSFTAYTLLLSFFFVSIENIALWKKIHQIQLSTNDHHLTFYLSMPVFLFSCFNIIFSIILLPYLHKIIVTLLLLFSAIASYAMINYGTFINTDMIENLFQSNHVELLSYASFSALLWLFLFFIIPSFILFFINIERQKLSSTIKIVLSSITAIFIIFILFYENYSFMCRNNQTILFLINPTNYIGSTIKYLTKSAPKQTTISKRGVNAVNLNQTKTQKNLLILVIGETSRGMNYSLNGYSRITNPTLSTHDVISFQNFQSCGTATAVSVPCMFSGMTRKTYNQALAKQSENLLDILHHANINELWRDNDEGCKGVCDRINHQDMTALNDPTYCHHGSCYDDILLKNLKKYLSTTKQDSVITLHLVGSHGPNYYQRYPKNFAVFLPDCNRKDIQNCDHQSLINTYDNTIIYTDHVISELITLLKTQKNKNTTLIYVSDHGESLGENGFYLHGLPYAIAPKEETTVPFIVWLSHNTITSQKINTLCLKQESLSGQYSQDYLFSSVLGIMNVSTKEYNKNLDIFYPCREQ